MNPKISVIIPTRNGARYLPYCVESVISQLCNNTEVIISNNHSGDDTEAYLSTLKDKRVRVVKPPELLNLAGHYDFATSVAKGDWIILVGDDDAVMPYFFELADFLIQQADKSNLKLINSRRANYVWPEPGRKTFTNYSAVDYCTIEKTKPQILKLLCGYTKYFHMPQCYTTSFFHRSVFDEARQRQGGILHTYYPPDVCHAAMALSLEERYLNCNIPFAWVGDSPKSLGRLGYNATKHDTKDDIIYKLEWGRAAEDIKTYLKVHSMPLYFYEALLATGSLQTDKNRKKFRKTPIKLLVCAAALRDVKKININVEARNAFLKSLCIEEKINFSTVRIFSRTIIPLLLWWYAKKDKFSMCWNSKNILAYREDNADDSTIAEASNVIAGVSSKFVSVFIGRFNKKIKFKNRIYLFAYNWLRFKLNKRHIITRSGDIN